MCVCVGKLPEPRFPSSILTQCMHRVISLTSFFFFFLSFHIWLKNQHAKYKLKNPENVLGGQPEISGCSEEVSGSTHSHGHLFVLASVNVESMSPGTSTVGSFLKLTSSLKAPKVSFHDNLAWMGTRYSPVEGLLDVQGPVTATDLGQPAGGKTQSDLAVVEVPVSVETPVPPTAESQRKDYAKYSYPTSVQLWR